MTEIMRPSRAGAHPAAVDYGKARRTRGLPRVAWVLVASAFACGALISGAVFASVWRHQAQRGDSTAAALALVQQHNAALSTSLIAAQTAARRAELQATTAKAQTHATALNAAHRAAKLTAALKAAGRAATTASGTASAVAGDLAKLTSELKTLTTYLVSTPPSQLDSGYVASQTDYLTRAVARLDGEDAALQSAATAYARSARAAAFPR